MLLSQDDLLVPLMTVGQLARLVGCHHAAVRHWSNRGDVVWDGDLINPAETLRRLMEKPPSYRGGVGITREQLDDAETELVRLCLMLSVEKAVDRRAEPKRRRKANGRHPVAPVPHA